VIIGGIEQVLWNPSFIDKAGH